MIPKMTFYSWIYYEQIEEEQSLTQELRKIEARKKEREKKAQDLQKLITGSESPAEPRKQEKRPAQRKRFQSQIKMRADPNVCTIYTLYCVVINLFIKIRETFVGERGNRYQISRP